MLYIVYRRLTIKRSIEAEVKMSKARETQTDRAEDSLISGLAKALGHPARVGIVKMLYERQACIGCDIVERIGLAQSTISEHLRILKAAGIITGEIEGPRVCYSLNPASLEPLRCFLGDVVDPSRENYKTEQGPLHVSI